MAGSDLQWQMVPGGKTVPNSVPVTTARAGQKNNESAPLTRGSISQGKVP